MRTRFNTFQHTSQNITRHTSDKRYIHFISIRAPHICKLGVSLCFFYFYMWHEYKKYDTARKENRNIALTICQSEYRKKELKLQRSLFLFRCVTILFLFLSIKGDTTYKYYEIILNPFFTKRYVGRKHLVSWLYGHDARSRALYSSRELNNVAKCKVRRIGGIFPSV